MPYPPPGGNCGERPADRRAYGASRPDWERGRPRPRIISCGDGTSPLPAERIAHLFAQRPLRDGHALKTPGLLLPAPRCDTILHVKTTVEISPALVGRCQRLAQKERLTLSALVEEGLRRVIADRERKPAFRLRRTPFTGGGFCKGFDAASWNRVRDAIYDGRSA